MPPLEIRHLLPYNAEQAHEYYIKNRQLKGRQPGAVKPVPKRRPVGRLAVKAAPKKVAVPKKSSAQIKAEANAAVKKLQAKLTSLQEVLAELVKQAKTRSGVTTPPKAVKKSTKTKAPTNAQKSAAAKAAHDYYEKHKASMPDATPAEQEKALTTKIKAIEVKIKAVKAQLAAAAKQLQPKPVHITAAPPPLLSKKKG